MIEYNSSRDGTLSDQIDWRKINLSKNNKLTYIINKKQEEKNYISEVKDQTIKSQGCSASFAFAITSLVESDFLLKK